MSHHVSLDPRRLSTGEGRAEGAADSTAAGTTDGTTGGTTACATAATAAATAAGRHAWERGLKWWHRCFGLLLIAVALSLWSTPDLSLTRKLTVSALFAGIAVWYATAGRRALGRSRLRDSLVYLTGLFALFVPAVVLYGAASLLLMVLCAQFFMLLEIRWAVLTVVAFNAIPAAYNLSRDGWHTREVIGALGWGALIVGFSVALALWIRSIIVQSAERAELIEQLEATRTELATANHEAGVLAERERLAAEIHDTLAQGFTSILMLLQAVESEVDHDPAESRRHLALAKRTAQENLAEARTLVAALAPARLDETSLVEALRRLVADVGAALGIPADFDVSGDLRTLPAGSEVVLLRATQEALANVRKHAGASHLAVRLDYGEQTRLEVTDDGRGFEPATTPNGHGLRGMRTRVEQVGGTLQIVSAPQTGTSTRVILP